MEVDIRQVERLMALLSVGVTLAVERGLLTTAEATEFCFRPYVWQGLERHGAREAVVNLVQQGSEIEDIEDIVPRALGAALVKLREAALASLEGAGEYPFDLGQWIRELLWAEPNNEA